MTLEVLSALNMLTKAGICTPEETSGIAHKYMFNKDMDWLKKEVCRIKARTEAEGTVLYAVLNRLSSIEIQKEE